MPVLARVSSDKWSIAAMAELYLLHFRASRPFAVDLMAEQNPLPYHCAYSTTTELLTLLPGPFLLFDCITRKFPPLKERDPSSAAPLTEPADETHLLPIPYKNLLCGGARGYAASIMLHGAQIGSYNTIYIFLAILEASRHNKSIYNPRSWRPCTEKIAY